MTIDIRQIRAEDIEGFYAALGVVIGEREYLAFDEPPPIAATRAFVMSNVARGNPQLVAVEAGRIIGWCDIVPMERPTMAHVGVLGIALLPEARGKGLGERLMRATLAAGRAFGLTRVELGVRVTNERAAALYRKLGFVEEGVSRRRVVIDGVPHDEIAMALLFD